jgi:hypothetical protein
MVEPVAAAGWQIATGFAASFAADRSRNFYAVYTGDNFGHPERGIVGAIARGHPKNPGQARGARDAAQLVVHSLAEGYFGAQRTLSARRAAGLALNAVNRWLFGQPTLAPVSLAALFFHSSRIAIVQLGACQLYRYRNRHLDPLGVNAPPRGTATPNRAIGLDADLPVDFLDEDVAVADRFVLLAGVEAAENLYATLSERLANGPADPREFAESLLASLDNVSGPDKAAMILDILAAPKPNAAATPGLADLPLRPAPQEGAVWDGFAIGKTLYRGRYTILKAAYDTVEKRDVVLKIPLPTMLTDEIFAAGFMREAWIGSTVRGSTVAHYLELPPDRRSSLYLVMPHYHGETLEARLHRAPAVSLPEGIGIALKLCEAVQDLAAIQIVHRDIKPENIMLLRNNEVRLLDLGLAYLPGIDMADSVKPGGTIRYMAPELLQGVPANPRSEVYALGVTLYRMFAGGAYPFGQREAVPLARLRPDMPGWLGEALARCLAPKPADRFADSGALAAALQTGLTTRPEAAPAKPRFRLPVTPLQLWQALTFAFAALSVYLLLRGR